MGQILHIVREKLTNSVLSTVLDTLIEEPLAFLEPLAYSKVLVCEMSLPISLTT